ncbi:MAG: type II toxin-antitoxin system Phd/YefM family antitoxin [Thermomicrobiales bacterium]
MVHVDTADLISISEANKLGISGLVREAEAGREQIVLRNNRPVAAVVSIERLEQLQEIEDDLLDASLATARMLTTGARRYSLDEVLAQLGFTREQLRDVNE